MPIEPKEMVAFAGELLSKSESEQDFRSIINRAYYGAFLTARDKAGIKNSGGSIHKEVIDYYQTRVSKVSNNLSVLKKLRQKADYEIHKDVTRTEARQSCSKARSIVESLS